MEVAAVHRSTGAIDDKIPWSSWGWLAVAAGFVVWFVTDGIVVSYAILLNHFLVRKEENLTLLSWIGSIARGHVMVIGIVGGPLTKRFGCPLITMVGCFICFAALLLSSFVTRAVYLLLTFGIFGGWGFSLAMMPSVFQATLYFKKHKALALGLITCGSGAGPILFAPLSQYIIDISSWREVFIMNSIMCLILCVFVANHTRPQSPWQTYAGNYHFFKSSLRKCGWCHKSRDFKETDIIRNKKKSGSLSSNWKMNVKVCLQVASSPRLVVMCLAGFVTHLGQFLVPLFLPAYASATGIDDFKGAVLLSYLGAANTIGRVWIGWFIDKKWLPVLIVYLAILLMGSIVTFIVPFISNYTVLAVLAVLYGVSIGTNLGMRSVIVFEYMGDEVFHESFGFYLAATGLGSALGPPIAGWVFSALSDSYKALFGVGAAFLLAGCLVWSVVPFVKKDAKKKDLEEEPRSDYTNDILCGYD